MSRLAFAALVICVSVGCANAQSTNDLGLDVEGLAEDLSLYVLAGDECSLSIHPKASEIGHSLMQLDEAAFLRGSTRGVTLFKGTMTYGKKKVCEAAKLARPKVEAGLDTMAKGLAAAVKLRGLIDKPR